MNQLYYDDNLKVLREHVVDDDRKMDELVCELYGLTARESGLRRRASNEDPGVQDDSRNKGGLTS